MKDRKYFDYLNDYELLKNGFATGGFLIYREA
jgi:hypothetical protein